MEHQECWQYNCVHCKQATLKKLCEMYSCTFYVFYSLWKSDSSGGRGWGSKTLFHTTVVSFHADITLRMAQFGNRSNVGIKVYEEGEVLLIISFLFAE